MARVSKFSIAALAPMKAVAVFLLVLCSVCGCITTAGPFVTKIHSDGQGNLVVEKAMVTHNALFGTITTRPGTTVFVTVVPNDNAAHQKLRAREATLKAKNQKRWAYGQRIHPVSR